MVPLVISAIALALVIAFPRLEIMVMIFFVLWFRQCL